MNSLYDRAKELISSDKFVTMIGGEHSVSAPVIRAHAEKYSNLSILQIDAHADLRDTYDGTPYSHASIMARVVKDLHIPAVQVGIRSISVEGTPRTQSTADTNFLGKRHRRSRDDWWDEAVDGLTENVYLTLRHIESIDPSLVSATGTPEPGGVGLVQTIGLLAAPSRVSAKYPSAWI